MRSPTCFRSLALAALLGSLPAFAASSSPRAYMTIVGAAGPARGNSGTRAASTGGTQRFPILQCSAPAQAPRFGSGPHELKFTKEAGTSSAPLRASLADGEALKEIKIDFFRPAPDGSGSEQLFYTIKLTGVNVTGIREFAASAGFGRQQKLEEISVTFQKIQWVTAPGGSQGGPGWGNQ